MDSDEEGADLPQSRQTQFRFYQAKTSKFRPKSPGYIGVDAFKNYYSKYKNIEKETEGSPHGYSACTAYMSHCQNSKMIPQPLGLIAHQGVQHSISVKNKSMGAGYA